MKVAITGGDGFLGSVVVRKLKSQNIDCTLFNFKKHNLLDPAHLKSFVSGKDIIIHLAAINRGENIELFKVNALGTLNLLEAASRYSPQSRIIFSSTFQVYLNSGLYGLSKKVAEDLIAEYTKKTSLKGTVFRISNIYGPGGKPFYNSVIATFAHLIKEGKPININGNGSQKRDFIYVDDVAEAIVKAVLQKNQKSFEIVDICRGRETTLKEILRILKIVSCKKFEIMYNKTVKEKPWPTSGKNYKIAKSLLNWKPTTSLKEGLTAVIKYGQR